MLAARALSIPPPRSNDIDEVDCALTVAHARWRSGDFDDALKWVRKAARCAADTDQVERAVELSKSAAALEQVIRTTPPPQLQAAVKTDRPRWPASTALAKRRSARQPAARSGQHPLASR